MKCRIDIKGRKVWVDNNNLHNTRPPSVEIVLRRDGEIIYKPITLDSDGNGMYKFPCLLIRKNNSEKYVYEVDEIAVPDGYSKTIRGYDVINTLNNITIRGVKTWDDDHNKEGDRPIQVRIRLLQNGTEVGNWLLPSPPAGKDTSEYILGERPFADQQGVPYIYQLIEDPVENYETKVTGYDLTNVYQPVVVPFSFTKKSVRTGMALQDAAFELRKNGVVKATAVSDSTGKVTFIASGTGKFQLIETLPPVGYMENTQIYEVELASDGTVTIDGQPAEDFVIENRPVSLNLLLERATGRITEYMAEPNTWPLHGSGSVDLFMTDKILITPEITPVTVKWDYDIKDIAYFAANGYDITSNYANGITVSANGRYTVYARFGNGYETVATINIDRIRDGSKAMPYLLIDYQTADALEPSVTGTGQYSLDFLHGGSSRLAQNYELYENVDMTQKNWAPLGDGTVTGFTGSFYGNGNDIENMSISVSGGSTYNTGMFARVSNGAVIEKFRLINCTVINTNLVAAGFVGYVFANDGSTTILRDLSFSGILTSLSSRAAGIATTLSVLNGNVIIDGCTAEGIITGVSCGGIVGYLNTSTIAGTVTISNCHTAGKCYATESSITNYAGGILGDGFNSGYGQLKIENCVNAMGVESAANAGGIIGVGNSSNNCTITSCLNSGEIKGANHVGGIAGDLTGLYSENNMVLENCYNAAKITANGITTTYSGGIIGACYSYVNIRNSYNTGDVVASTPGTHIVGGISGNYGIINNCAAINALCSSPQSSIARISQNKNFASQSTLDNNAAFNSMQVLINGAQKTPLDEGAGAVDGLSAAKALIKTQNLYENDLSWDFTGVWDFGNGGYTLPILKGIPLNLQPDTLPLHLV